MLILLIRLGLVLVLSLVDSLKDNVCIITNSNDSCTECYSQCCSSMSLHNLTDRDNISNVHICIQSEIQLLNDILLTNYKEVLIEGTQSTASFTCLKDKPYGIEIKDVHIVKLRSFTIRGCQLSTYGKSKFKTTSKNTIVAAAILIVATSENTDHHADIVNLNIFESGEIGIEFVNLSNISAITSEFSNNKQGIKVSFALKSTANNLLIKECRFSHNNEARNLTIVGGGLLVYLTNNAIATAVIKDCTFEGNFARHGGGVAFMQNFTNTFATTFIKCKFYNNSGISGGGLYIEVAQNWSNENKSSQYITFKFCVWLKNNGIYGSAGNILSKSSLSDVKSFYLPAVNFRDCKFTENSNVHKAYDLWQWYYFNLKFKSKGTLYLVRININLIGNTTFRSNYGSAINAEDSDVSISTGAVINYYNNTGFDGGALALQGESRLLLHRNTTIKFICNNAINTGGAIFQRDYTGWSVKLCVMSKSYNRIDFLVSNLYFKYNSAKIGGQSVFTTSIPFDGCAHDMILNTSHCNKGLQYSVRATFNECRVNEIEAFHQVLKKQNITSYLEVIPGKPKSIFVVDDNTPILDVSYRAIIYNSSTVMLDPEYKIIYNNKIVLLGPPNSSAMLRLYFHYYEASIEVRLTDCPPGFILQNKTCLCSSDLQPNHEQHLNFYQGIIWCDHIKFQAMLLPGNWAGNISKNFCTSQCPLDFCSSNHRNTTGNLLPDHKMSDYSAQICSPNKKGILCGTCTENHSVFYHDNTYSCHPNRHCEWGWFLYIVSELLPATLFFLVIILFGVTLTHGGINGFVFYMQILEYLIIYGRGLLIDPNNIRGKIFTGLYLLTCVLNLSFLSVKDLSFCLMKNATALDMIAFNYFTLLYCLVLVVVTVAVMNKFSIKLNVYFGLDKYKLSKTIIHGLSSFLVLCYFQCTKVSLLLLSSVDVCGSHRVFYNGDLIYFKNEHLPYAIPALCFLITITMMPPVLLICYPLCYKIFSLFHMEESKAIKLLCKCIPMEKYKPLFDSFQSSFKDEHHYFAGLYFLYRFFILLLIMLNKKLRTFYVALEVMLLAMLTIHSCIYPYKNRWHNRIDTLIFSLLLLLNTLTILNFQQRTARHNGEDYVQYTTVVQVALAWLPLIVLVVYLAIITGHKVKSYLASKRVKNDYRLEELLSSTSMLEAVNEREQGFEAKYNKN